MINTGVCKHTEQGRIVGGSNRVTVAGTCCLSFIYICLGYSQEEIATELITHADSEV
jgi:hypothetical protein